MLKSLRASYSRLTHQIPYHQGTQHSAALAPLEVSAPGENQQGPEKVSLPLATTLELHRKKWLKTRLCSLSRVLCYHAPPSALRHGFSLNPGLTSLSKVRNQQARAAVLSSSPQSWVPRMHEAQSLLCGCRVLNTHFS